jgi:hypothetical protein
MMTRASWLWPMIITLSLLAAIAAIVTNAPQAVRAPAVLWFLVVCPGMAFVRLLQVRDAWAEWTLAIALSLAIDALVAIFILYVGLWSPTWILVVIATLTLAGVLFQFASAVEQTYRFYRRPLEWKEGQR